MLAASMRALSFCWFQSTPDREAGRCKKVGDDTTPPLAFQSTPDREAGRCGTAAALGFQWRGFNPRPTVRPGDAKLMLVSSPTIKVSIHARP